MQQLSKKYLLIALPSPLGTDFGKNIFFLSFAKIDSSSDFSQDFAGRTVFKQTTKKIAEAFILPLSGQELSIRFVSDCDSLNQIIHWVDCIKTGI